VPVLALWRNFVSFLHLKIAFDKGETVGKTFSASKKASKAVFPLAGISHCSF